jgi:hypothetical protein
MCWIFCLDLCQPYRHSHFTCRIARGIQPANTLLKDLQGLSQLAFSYTGYYQAKTQCAMPNRSRSNRVTKTFNTHPYKRDLGCCLTQQVNTVKAEINRNEKLPDQWGKCPGSRAVSGPRGPTRSNTAAIRGPTALLCPAGRDLRKSGFFRNPKPRHKTPHAKAPGSPRGLLTPNLSVTTYILPFCETSSSEMREDGDVL